MRLARPASAAFLVRSLLFASFAALVVLMLLDRGATRAYAFPWSVVRLIGLAAPIAALAAAALAPGSDFRLPPTRWRLAAGLFFAGTLGSALLSPFPGVSLREALTPLALLAVFLLAHDWLAGDWAARENRLLRTGGWFAAGIVVLSLARWFVDDLLPAGAGFHLSWIIDHRNEHPLGHSNYTAGLALLALPWFGALAWRSDRRRARFGWRIMAFAALVLLFSSGSRGGLVGLGALLLAALMVAKITWQRRIATLLLAGVGVLALALLHPRTRTMLFSRPNPSAAPNISNVQRTAMLTAGVRMGADRPLLGWGPGTTPLVFPRYRGGLDGGAEDVLQLHSTPVQFWADGGVVTLAGVLLFAALVAGRARRHRPAFVTLAGYGVFALTDYQLDVPVFAAAVAICAAFLTAAPPEERHLIHDTSPRWLGRVVGGLALVSLAIVALLGRADPTPALNTRALSLATRPDGEERAIALLRDSLALNPAQEIAHFNLGWLLVVREPAEAEQHFLAAARLVPDKGGVYFGLGLARLNQDRPADAAAAFALECLDDPLFLSSPWWRDPRIGAARGATISTLHRLASSAAVTLAARGDARRAGEARYVAALGAWLDGHAPLGDVLRSAHTTERVSFFAARPSPPDFGAGGVLVSHRERTGYPVLMRQLDLPPPVDVFTVEESATAVNTFPFLFPPKGWLPGPLVLALLDAPASAKP